MWHGLRLDTSIVMRLREDDNDSLQKCSVEDVLDALSVSDLSIYLDKRKKSIKQAVKAVEGE